ncbi:immunity 52 family protein [Corallococcus sp. bb12-1]|nr:immunity 52 family protein [Corallococcus sp. bb12-1]
MDLRITCGDYSGANPNSCVMPLPRKGHNVARIITVPVLTGVLRSMVHSWEPDWAFATSDAYEAMHHEADASLFSLGWLTYLSHQRGTVPPLPAPVRIEPVEDRGTLIILTPERFTVANPEHIALARRVRELLAGAGLLKPASP